MEWYYYILWFSLILWLFTPVVLYLKGRYWMSTFSFTMPILMIIALLVITIAVLLLPLIYLIAFLYSIIIPQSQDFRLIKID